MKDDGMKDDGMTDLRKARASQQEAGGMFRRGAEMVTRIFFCCLFFPVLIAFICFQGFLWFGVWVGVFWFVFLFGAFILFIWQGGQWCEEKVAGTRALLFLVIFFFLPFIASIIIALFPPDPLPAAHITALLNVKITGPAFAAILGFLLFAQRLDVMNRQVIATQAQVNLAQEQFDLEQKQFDFTQRQHKATEYRHEAERFDQACELLGNKEMVTRLGGITLLGALARTRPEEWHITVIDTLALFIRERSMNDDESPVKGFLELVATKEKDEKEAKAKWKKLYDLENKKAPDDIEKAMGVIACNLTEAQKTVVQKHFEKVRRWPDLSESWLCSIRLTGAYLPRALLRKSFLCRTNLTSSDLTKAELALTHLRHTRLNFTKLQDAFFAVTHVAYTHLYEAEWHNGFPSAEDFICVEGEKPFQPYMETYIKGKRQPHPYDKIKTPDPISVMDFWKTVHENYK